MTLDITPGVDCRLRLFSETPTGFHELGRFDCFHDALRAKEAAEQTAESLRVIFGLPELPSADVKNARPDI